MCLLVAAGGPALATDAATGAPKSAGDFIRALTPTTPPAAPGAPGAPRTRGVTLGTGDSALPPPAATATVAPAPAAVVSPAVAVAPAPKAASAAPAPKVTPAVQPVPAAPKSQPQSQPKAAFQVTFAFNSDVLSPEATTILDELGRALVSNQLQGFKFRLVGHTDGVGSPSYNLDLSKRRARSVQDYLVRTFQLPPGRLTATGRGSEQLLDRANPANDANRRVEIINLGS